MKLHLLGAAVVVLCLVGCNKPKSEVPPAPVAAPKSASIEAEAPAAPPPPAATAPAGDAPAGEAAAEAPGLEEINRALSAYSMAQMKEPSTLEDLVKAGYIKKVPAAPPGKRFVLNANRTAVLVVDK